MTATLNAAPGDATTLAIPDDLLTPAEAAARLRVSTGALYERIGRGDIPSYRFGRVIRLRARHVAEYLERGHRTQVAPPRYVRAT